MLIDSHCHMDEYKDIDKVIKNASDNNVDYLVVSGSTKEDNEFNIKLLNKYDNIFLSCGYHPYEASKISNKDLDLLEEYIKNNKVVAIGEIGLDYHYGKDDIEKQKKLFKKQLDLAVKYNMPVVIHTRDAFLDTYNILKEYKLKGVIHCFSGSVEVAKQYIDLGYNLGIGGVINFQNSTLKDVIKEIGISNVMLETDSPYLSPRRGEKNEPKNIKVIAEFIANLLNMPFDEVAKITTENTICLFDLKL